MSKKLSRRDFFKSLGGAAVGAGLVTLLPEREKTTAIPEPPAEVEIKPKGIPGIDWGSLGAIGSASYVYIAKDGEIITG